MSNIFEKFDKKLSDKKAKEKKETDRLGKLKIKVYKLNAGVFKKHFKEDYKKLDKLFKKHTHKYYDEDVYVIYIGNPSYELRVNRTIPNYNKSHLEVPDEWIVTVEIKMINRKSKEEYLKTYKFSENNFALRVSCLGDPEDELAEVTRNKEFEIKDKEKAYEYMMDLFEKKILW